jgi:hypothetical protein
MHDIYVLAISHRRVDTPFRPEESEVLIALEMLEDVKEVPTALVFG